MAIFKYQKVADEIREMVIKETLQYKLPTEHELMTKFNVSRITIKKALDILKDEDLLYTVQGSGTYVNSLKKGILTSTYKKNNFGFRKEHIGLNYDTQVLDYKIINCPIHVATYLSLRPMDQVYKIQRLRLLNNTPDRYEVTYIPTSIIPGLTYKVCEHSIYEYITSDLNLSIDKTHDYFFTSHPSPLDCKYLNIVDDSIIINLEQLGFLKDGSKFQYSVTKYLHSSFNYKNITYFND